MQQQQVDFIIKEAWVAGAMKALSSILPSAATVASTTGHVLGETVPSAFKAIQTGASSIGINAANRSAIKWGLPAIGATVGGARGYAKADEGSKGTGALMGAVGGAAIGSAAAWGANKIPTLGNKFVTDFKPIGQALHRTGTDSGLTYKNLGNKMLDRGTEMTAEKWVTPRAGTQVQNMFKGTSKADGIRVGDGRTMAAGGLHTTLDSFKALRDGGAKGVYNALKKDVVDKTLFEQVAKPGNTLGQVPGATYRGKRSALGQVVNPLFASGVGMGAMDALTATNEDGSKASIGKRLRKGTTSALGWGLAPPVMVGKLVYDSSKSIIGGQKPQQDITN